MTHDITPYGESGSPFDAIRRVRADGSEFWSARDLMPVMGYPRWQDFTPVLDRARASADNQMLDIADLFRVNPEKTGGRPREDLELSRFAAYLVAMNGDLDGLAGAGRLGLDHCERIRQVDCGCGLGFTGTDGADGSVRDGYEHRKPTAKGRRYFYAHDNGTYGGRRRFQPRVRPQMEIALRDALAAEGLPVNQHSSGLILLSSGDMKELGA